MKTILRFIIPLILFIISSAQLSGQHLDEVFYSKQFTEVKGNVNKIMITNTDSKGNETSLSIYSLDENKLVTTCYREFKDNTVTSTYSYDEDGMIKQIHESVGLVIDYEWSDNKKICDAYYTLPSKPKFLKCRLVFDEKNYLKERTKYLNESDNSSVTTQYQYSSGKIIKEVKDGVITKENLYAEDALYKTILYKDGMQLSYTTFQKLDNQTTQQIIYHDSTAVSMMIEYTDEKIQKIDNYSFDQEKNLTLTRTTTTSYDTLGNVASIEMAAKDVVSKTDYKYY